MPARFVDQDAPVGNVATIMAEMIERGKGKVEFADAFRAYAQECHLKGKSPVSPPVFASCDARASGTSDLIVILLRDGVAVRREEPRFAAHQQPVQVTQCRQRNLRDAHLEGSAIYRVELPSCHHRDDTGLKLKMCDLFGRAPLN